MHDRVRLVLKAFRGSEDPMSSYKVTGLLFYCSQRCIQEPRGVRMAQVDDLLGLQTNTHASYQSPVSSAL